MDSNYKHIMCRLCLCSNGSLSDIHGCKVGSELIAAAVIADLLRIEVSVTDSYPQLVCLECLKKLYDFQRFKDSCWKAKFHFDAFFCNPTFPNVNGPGEECVRGVNTVLNYGISMDTDAKYFNRPTAEVYMRQSEECPNSYAEECKKGKTFSSEIDIKEEPIEAFCEDSISSKESESAMRDPLSFESSHSNLGDIPPVAITIKEEETQINEIMAVKKPSVVLKKETGTFTFYQTKPVMERDTLHVKQPYPLSTKYLSKDHPNANGVESHTNTTKSIMERRVIPDTFFAKQPYSSSTKHLTKEYPYANSAASHTDTTMPIMERRDIPDTMHVKQPHSLSTKNLSKDIPYANGAASHTKTVTSIQPVGNDSLNKKIVVVPPIYNNQVSRGMLLFPSGLLVQLNIQGQTGNVTAGMQVRKEDTHSTVDKMKIREESKNSTVNAVKMGINGESNPVSPFPSVESVSNAGQIQKSCDQETGVPNPKVPSCAWKAEAYNKWWKSQARSTCPICRRNFSTSTSLKKHIGTHSEKLFECNQCHQKFRTEKSLQGHSKKHRENRPYRCKICGAGFCKEDLLFKHLQMHAGDNPFQCDRCGRKYDHKRLLRIHVARCYKVEINKCDICNKKFHSKIYLSVHKTIHTGEKNLMCEVCGKTFRGDNTLRIHKRQHTGEKPYYCDICDKRFTQSVSLKMHNQKYHKA